MSIANPTWQDASKIAEDVVQFGLSKVPVVGGLLSALTGALWPNANSAINPATIWSAIRDRVDQAITKAIDDLVYANRTADIDAIKGFIDEFDADVKNNVGNGVTGGLQVYFDNKRTSIKGLIPNFQLSGHELQLLPLFAPTVQLYLAFVRNGLGNPLIVDPTSSYYQTTLQELQGDITAYGTYATNTYTTNQTNGTAATAPLAMPAWVDFHNLMVKGVLNYVYYWPYMDPSKYSGQLTELLPPPNETLCGPVGGSTGAYYPDGFTRYDLNEQGPITQITVWWDHTRGRMTGVQVDYGSTAAPLMACNAYRTNENPFPTTNISTQVIPVSLKNPIVRIYGNATDVVDSLAFEFQDGTCTPLFGNANPNSGSTPFSYQLNYTYSINNTTEQQNFVLSSITFNQDIDDGYNSNYEGFDLSGLVFGFRDPGSYPVAQRTAQAPTATLPLGVYQGTYTSSYGGQTASYTLQIVVSESTETTFQATMHFAPANQDENPLGGGSFTGTCADGQLRFTTSDGYLTTWTGQLEGDTMQGTYNGNQSNGSWQVTRSPFFPGIDGGYVGQVTNDDTQAIGTLVLIVDTANGLTGSMTLGPELNGGGALTGTYSPQNQQVQFTTADGIVWEAQFNDPFLASGTYNIPSGGGSGNWLLTKVSSGIQGTFITPITYNGIPEFTLLTVTPDGNGGITGTTMIQNNGGTTSGPYTGTYDETSGQLSIPKDSTGGSWAGHYTYPLTLQLTYTYPGGSPTQLTMTKTFQLEF